MTDVVAAGAAAPVKKKRVAGAAKKKKAGGAKRPILPPARVPGQKTRKSKKAERERQRRMRKYYRKMGKRFFKAYEKQTPDVPETSFRKFALARMPENTTSHLTIGHKAFAPLQLTVESLTAREHHALALILYAQKRRKVQEKHIQQHKYSKYPVTEGVLPSKFYAKKGKV